VRSPSRRSGSVLSIVIVAALGAAWAAVTYFAPKIATTYQVSFREAMAWGARRRISSLRHRARGSHFASLQRQEGGSLATTLNGGAKPSITLKHHGRATTYRVDGRMVSLVDGTLNPQPAAVRAELQVGGIMGEWDALLKDGEWANIILGSLEPVFPKSADPPLSAVQSWTPIGQQLVIRRGKIGQDTRVPDTGALCPTGRPTCSRKPQRRS
jgi:hypothetical protein